LRIIPVQLHERAPWSTVPVALCRTMQRVLVFPLGSCCDDESELRKWQRFFLVQKVVRCLGSSFPVVTTSWGPTSQQFCVEQCVGVMLQRFSIAICCVGLKREPKPMCPAFVVLSLQVAHEVRTVRCYSPFCCMIVIGYETTNRESLTRRVLC